MTGPVGTIFAVNQIGPDLFEWATPTGVRMVVAGERRTPLAIYFSPQAEEALSVVPGFAVRDDLRDLPLGEVLTNVVNLWMRRLGFPEIEPTKNVWNCPEAALIKWKERHFPWSAMRVYGERDTPQPEPEAVREAPARIRQVRKLDGF